MNPKEYFDKFLNGITCRLKCGSLFVEGTLEQRVSIYSNFIGLDVCIPLKYNNKNIHAKIKDLTTDRKLFPYGQVHDYIHTIFINELENFEITVATITPCNVKSIESNFYKEELSSCKIIYENGTICELYGIKRIFK